MGFRVALLELFDVGEKALNLVTSFADIVIELGVCLVPSVDLGLEIFDRAVDIA